MERVKNGRIMEGNKKRKKIFMKTSLLKYNLDTVYVLCLARVPIFVEHRGG